MNLTSRCHIPYPTIGDTGWGGDYNSDIVTADANIASLLSTNEFQQECYFDSHVGIGKTTPNAPLAIQTASFSGDNRGIRMWGLTYSTDLSYWNEGGIALKYNGVFRHFLNSTGNSYLNGGNVGIGTTAPTTALDMGASGVITTAGGTSTQWNAAAAHKTTEDALVGLVLVDGSGNYSAIANNSSNWNAAFGMAHYSYNYNTDGASKQITLFTVPAISNGATPLHFDRMFYLDISHIANSNPIGSENRVYRVYYRTAIAPNLISVSTDIYHTISGSTTTVTISMSGSNVVITMAGTTSGDELEVGLIIK